jgi:hypothetical protein
MIALANLILKGPLQAYLTAVTFALLAIWFGPIGFLAGVTIALITLRVGIVEGAKVFGAAAISHVVVSTALSSNYWPALIVLLEFMLPVWFLAVVLRQTNSLGSTLQLAGLIAGTALIAVHLLIGDMPAWWMGLFNQFVQPILSEAGVDYDLGTIEQMAGVMTMLIAMFAVSLWFSIVMTARWMQGVLYYPGQFQKDFHALRLPKNVAVVTTLVAIGSLFFNEASGGLLGDLFGLLTLVLMFQGLAIVHDAVEQKQWSSGWLFGLYFLLFVFPQTVLVLAIIGMADAFSDFRSRWEKS